MFLLQGLMIRGYVFQHIQFAPQAYWVMTEGVNKSDFGSCSSFCVLFRVGCLFLQVFLFLFFVFVFFFKKISVSLLVFYWIYGVTIPIHAPSPCALVVMLKEMDYILV